MQKWEPVGSWLSSSYLIRWRERVTASDGRRAWRHVTARVGECRFDMAQLDIVFALTVKRCSGAGRKIGRAAMLAPGAVVWRSARELDRGRAQKRCTLSQAAMKRQLTGSVVRKIPEGVIRQVRDEAPERVSAGKKFCRWGVQA